VAPGAAAEMLLRQLAGEAEHLGQIPDRPSTPLSQEEQALQPHVTSLLQGAYGKALKHAGDNELRAVSPPVSDNEGAEDESTESEVESWHDSYLEDEEWKEEDEDANQEEEEEEISEKDPESDVEDGNPNDELAEQMRARRRMVRLARAEITGLENVEVNDEQAEIRQVLDMQTNLEPADSQEEIPKELQPETAPKAMFLQLQFESAAD